MENAHVESIFFRDKSSGWKKYSFALTLSTTNRSGAKNTVSLCEVFPQNTFMKGFLKDLYLRPSCYSCPAKSGKSGSDITIGDLWGAPMIIGDKDDDRGISLVMVNKDTSLLRDTSLWADQIDYQSALAYNPSIERSVHIPPKRGYFFSLLNEKSVHRLVYDITKIPLLRRILNKTKQMIYRIYRIYK